MGGGILQGLAVLYSIIGNSVGIVRNVRRQEEEGGGGDVRAVGRWEESIDIMLRFRRVERGEGRGRWKKEGPVVSRCQ